MLWNQASIPAEYEAYSTDRHRLCTKSEQPCRPALPFRRAAGCMAVFVLVQLPPANPDRVQIQIAVKLQNVSSFAGFKRSNEPLHSKGMRRSQAGGL